MGVERSCLGDENVCVITTFKQYLGDPHVHDIQTENADIIHIGRADFSRPSKPNLAVTFEMTLSPSITWQCGFESPESPRSDGTTGLTGCQSNA